jgi:hypothetical protein
MKRSSCMCYLALALFGGNIYDALLMHVLSLLGGNI